ncbi:MAG: LysE family translocator [Pseudomonadota bacterium]
MPSTEILIAFFLAAAVFAYMPGPSTLYAAAQALSRGRSGGLMAALGLHIGGYIHVFAAALGLAVLFEMVPVLYTVMKLAGAAYLVWLGLRFMLQRGIGAAHSLPDVPRKSPVRAFWESATVEILNPKTALFYIAFLPQFTDPAASFPLWIQLLVLGTFVNILFSSADLLCVLLAARLTRTLRASPRSAKWANRVGGGLLVALGVNLATSK